MIVQKFIRGIGSVKYCICIRFISQDIFSHIFSALYRCIENDDEIQLLRKKAGELKEKLDEAESAIVELGQVNQSLQVFGIRA